MINTRLIAARERKGLKQSELASLLAVTVLTISRWENGIQIPRAYYVLQLCQIFGMTEKDLGLTTDQAVAEQKKPRMVYEMDEHFTFGGRKTTEIVLDGDGSRVYLPQHIRTHYNPIPLGIPQEFRDRKARIAQEQEEKRAAGGPFQWNGERYNLTRFTISRDPENEDMTLDLWFTPSDYYTFLATSTGLREQAIRQKYLADPEWDEAIPLFAHSFSALIAVITSDNYVILVRRGKSLGCRPSSYDVSLAEGLSRPADRGSASQAPNIYHCATRGLSEEMGLHAPADFSPADILFTTFAVDTEFCMWGLFGFVRLQRTREEVLSILQRGVPDKFENRRIFTVPFHPQDVSAFFHEHEPFSPGGIVCLYHALVHEYGRAEVDRAIAGH